MWYMLNVHTNVWISTYLYIFCIWSALQICWRLFHRFLVDFLGLPSFPTVDRLHPDLRVSVLVEKSMSVTSQIITLIELDDGKIYRKPLYLMVKTMVSCKLSLKPIHWTPPIKQYITKHQQPTGFGLTVIPLCLSVLRCLDQRLWKVPDLGGGPGGGQLLRPATTGRNKK